MIKIYVSHSIRGPKGLAATEKDMRYSCDRIKLIIGRLREDFPEIEFYLPAESEQFVGIAYREKFLTELQILNIDCEIIDTCNLVMIFVPVDDSEVQGGRLIEKAYAVVNGMPVLEFESLAGAAYQLNAYLGVYNEQNTRNIGLT